MTNPNYLVVIHAAAAALSHNQTTVTFIMVGSRKLSEHGPKITFIVGYERCHKIWEGHAWALCVAQDLSQVSYRANFELVR
jgi:hypothetical protein